MLRVVYGEGGFKICESFVIGVVREDDLLFSVCFEGGCDIGLNLELDFFGDRWFSCCYLIGRICCLWIFN